jgi:hypothetical protein
VGQRYLLVENIDTGSPWGVVAVANDIIEFDGAEWFVQFDSAATTSEEYVVNDFTGDQFKWTGSEWISSWQGTYNPGFWRILL